MNATWEGSPNLEGLGFQSKFILWLTVDGIQGNLNCRIVREREKKRENFLMKSYKLRHCRACSQNKGLSKYQRRASQLRTSPSPAGGREAGSLQPEPERGNLGPRNGILYQTVSRLPVANQVFLRSWMVDIHREGRSQRLAPQRRHMAHLRQHSCCAPGNRAAVTGEVIRHTTPPGESALAKYLVTWVARTWERHKTQPQPSLCLCGVPENLNLSGLDLGSARNPEPTLDSSPAEQPGAWAVLTGKAHTPWAGANPVWPQHCEHTASTPHTRQGHLFAVFLPPHSTTEQMSPNKWPPSPPCVRAEIRHWRDLQTEEAKINKREPLWKWQVQQIKTL